MKNADKMREIVGAPSATDREIENWAYMNRIWLCDLPDVPEFGGMKASVDAYMAGRLSLDDEDANWAGFLKADFVGMPDGGEGRFDGEMR